MAKISNTSSYPVKTDINGKDYVIGTDAVAENPSLQTKVFTMADIAKYVGNPEATQIPTPQMWVYKSGNVSPYQTAGASPLLRQRALCISVPTQIDKAWLDKTPRLFLFRYKPSNTSDGGGGGPTKRGNYVHPTHLNGQYIRTNFPGSNWGSSPQNYINAGGNPTGLFPITTEWNFNGDLKYVQKYESPLVTPGVAITDFKTVRSTAYVELPFNPLQFLFDISSPLDPFTLLPVSQTDLGRRCMASSGTNQEIFNTKTPWEGDKCIKGFFKFAIGIPNPTWTNTNKQTPYIMGDLSEAITFQYQVSGSGTPRILAYQIVQGHSSIISRQASN